MTDISMESSHETPRISNILPNTARTAQVAYLGQIRTCSRLLPVEIVFLVVSLLDVIGVVTFTTISLIMAATGNVQASTDTDITYAIIILINTAFCFGYIFSGLFREKMFDMIMLIASLSIVLIYCIADIAIQINNGLVVSPVKITRLVLVAVGSLTTIPLAVVVLRGFGFFVFNIAGATELLQTLYKRMSFFTSILTIDIQLSISIVVLVLKEGAKVDTAETVTLSVGLAAVIVWAVLGYSMSRIENRVGMALFEVIGVVAYAYIGWKSFIINKHSCTTSPDIAHSTTALPRSSTTSPHSSTTTFYCYTDKLLFATIGAEVLYCIVHLVVLITGVFVLAGFNKGLKEKLKEKDRGVVERIIDQVDS